MLVKIPNSKNRDKFRSQLISAMTITLYSLPDFRWVPKTNKLNTKKKDAIIEAPNNDTKIDIEKENFKAMSLIISIEI